MIIDSRGVPASDSRQPLDQLPRKVNLEMIMMQQYPDPLADKPGRN